MFFFRDVNIASDLTYQFYVIRNSLYVKLIEEFLLVVLVNKEEFFIAISGLC